MSEEKRALARHSAPPNEADYEAILAAVMETGRGRWFLHEFAQRNRHAETRGVLSAIERIEGLLRIQGGETLPAPDQAGPSQIATAIMRAQAMLGATTDEEASKVFEAVGQSLEAAQVRLRAVLTRLEDTATALREEGGQGRICSDLDRQIRDLETGCAQFDDASGDVRILIALLKEIESQLAPPPGTADAAAPAATPASAPATPTAVPPADSGTIAAPPPPPAGATGAAADIRTDLAEDENDASPAAALPEIARSEAPGAQPSLPEPAANKTRLQTGAGDEAASPSASMIATLWGNRISDPADFLLEPLPQDETAQGLAPAAKEFTAIDFKPAQPKEQPAASLPLDSFDPLAPLRALSDEEKIALFS